jgi:hypothetical protein
MIDANATRDARAATAKRYSSGREGEAPSYPGGDTRSRALANARVDASNEITARARVSRG